MKQLLFTIIILTALTGCSKKLHTYVAPEQKVGIVIRSSDFEIRKRTSISGTNALELAVNYGISKSLNSTKDKIHQEVDAAFKKQHPDLLDVLKEYIDEANSTKNHTFKWLDFDFNALDLKEHEPTFMKRKQAKYDYRPIGQEYDIDFLHIVDVQSYIELDGIGKTIKFVITPMVINMEDNSFMHASQFGNSIKIIGRWRDSPDHPRLMKMVQDNVDLTFEKFEKGYRPYH